MPCRKDKIELITSQSLHNISATRW